MLPLQSGPPLLRIIYNYVIRATPVIQQHRAVKIAAFDPLYAKVGCGELVRLCVVLSRYTTQVCIYTVNGATLPILTGSSIVAS